MMRSGRICLILVVLVSLLLAYGPLPSTTRAEGAAESAFTGLRWPVQQAEPAVNQTVILQQALDGYTGVRDTWISTAGWATPPQHTVNYGQNDTLVLSRDGGENLLLRFDLSSIPANSAVISASLSLYNTTQSSPGGNGNFARRVQLFPVLREWDEGNQAASPIDGPGKHGATGDQAFDFFTGEGADVAWAAPGMAAGADYASTAASDADVINQGWYNWDVTMLVRAWVRGEQANAGLLLRDATGYDERQNDSRIFVSSQATADLTLRPKLVVVYNPDVPFADAGPDQVNFGWKNTAIVLNGSASRDRPGGNDNSLTYTWRIVTAAYGSALAGEIASTAVPTATFTPDVAGEWEIELTVTNPLGERATDRLHLRLLSLADGHPRIFLTPAKLSALKARAVATNPRWVQLQNEADSADAGMHVKALVSQVTGQASYCDQAIAAALAVIANQSDYPGQAGDLALVYDWCYGRLSADQRTTFLNYFVTWSDNTPKNEDFSGWGNYWPRHGYSYALVGLATYGDNPRAQEWFDEYRHRRYQENDLPLLDRIADGGAWPEGMVYDWIANWPRVMAVEAWRTATGEDLFASTRWFRDRLGYILLHRRPGLGEQFGYRFHPYASTGDSERNRGSLTNYERVMALLLVERFAAEPLARQLQALLAAPPTDNSLRFLYHAEFLWFNPNQPTTPPSQLTHYAAGTGTLFLRSGWPSGPADSDTSATHITFQAGDHFSYHQHFDQNSFTLFKGDDLMVDSGVYSGEGLSNHDINYYVRTIAHNTLVVYNPAEDFAAARPDATANDGGQRTVFPASRSPQTMTDFNQHAVHYDTGDMLRFEDSAAYSYALGDATKAYNNPTYNQAMDTNLSGNVAKVSRFQREFVYLRPQPLAGKGQPGATAGEYLVLFDRVGVTQPGFSGQNTKLLFHSLNEPTVAGTPNPVSPGETLYANAGQATVAAAEASLTLKVLLPLSHHLRKVGGRGDKAFWVFDANYDWHWDAGEAQPRPINDFEAEPYGEWRLELEPADTALEHNFLTVLHPTLSGTVDMPATTLITTGLSGAHVADPALNRLVLFSAANDGSPPTGPILYSYQPTTRTLNLLFDLTPGARYQLSVESINNRQQVELAPKTSGQYQVSQQGVLSFTLDLEGEPNSNFAVYLPLMIGKLP
ncbi:MAG TPA: DNRLRE domain-containing protein [Caldilineaceae bacterium]|nr:DNRLRE domain-containing protein [Caldilineaceae bacterium]